jgi:hypothetical protein
MDFIGVLIAVALVGVIIAATVAMASRPWRGGPGSSGLSGMFGAMEEVFSPGRYEARIEQERQLQAPAPAATPGDKPTPGDEDGTEGGASNEPDGSRS